MILGKKKTKKKKKKTDTPVNGITESPEINTQIYEQLMTRNQEYIIDKG